MGFNPISGITLSGMAGAYCGAGKEKAYAAGRKVKETCAGISNEIGMHKKEIGIALGLVAFVAIAGAAIYHNREAISGFATEKREAFQPYLDSAGASIKEKYQSAHDYVMGKFNHITSGAQAGDAAKAPQIPANGGTFGIDSSGNFAWHATA